MTPRSISTFPWNFPFTFGGLLQPATSPRILEDLPEVITPEQIISLHTIDGVQLYQFLGRDLVDLSWSRESREVSRFNSTVPSTLDDGKIPDLQPWIHWVSAWDEYGEHLYWTGPIQRVTFDRQSMGISARDISAFFTRTRCPVKRRWDVADPAEIASVMWERMIELHGLHVEPIVRRDPFGDKFDYEAKGEGVMLDTVMDDLSRLGLYWTVVSGTPILGPMSRTVIASLDENDFVGSGLTLVRDGSNTFNDVLLRGADNLAQAKVKMAGLNLQTIVNVDDMFGVSNTQRAVQQHARYVSKIHDTVALPDDATLHPNAPVSIGQLIPSSRFVINAYGTMITMELTGVDVSFTPQTASVVPRLVVVDDDIPELLKLQGQTNGGGDS